MPPFPSPDVRLVGASRAGCLSRLHEDEVGYIETIFCAACDVAAVCHLWQQGPWLCGLLHMLQLRAVLPERPAVMAAMLFQYAWLLHNAIQVGSIQQNVWRFKKHSQCSTC